MEQINIQSKSDYDKNKRSVYIDIAGGVTAWLFFMGIGVLTDFEWKVGFVVFGLIVFLVCVVAFIIHIDYIDKINEEDRFHLKLYLDAFPELKPDVIQMLQKGFVVRVEFNSVREYLKNKMEFNFAYPTLQEENRQ